MDIQLRQSGELTQITVSDDGRGFSAAAPRKEGHFGLRILKDTIQQAGGTLHIRTAPGRGTAVTATFGADAPPATRWVGRFPSLGPGKHTPAATR